MGLFVKKRMSILIFLLLIILSPIALGTLCHSTVETGNRCLMLTPTLTNCSTFNYSIINTTGVSIASGNLTVFHQYVYSFNFTYTNSTGEYITLLCDGSTREIEVKNGETRMIAIAILFTVLILICALATAYFTSLGHYLTYIFMMLTVIFLDMAVWTIAKIATESSYSWSFVGWRLYWVMLFVTLIMFFALAIHLTQTALRSINQKKQDEKRIMFGDTFEK